MWGHGTLIDLIFMQKVGSSEHVRVLEYQNSFASSKEKLLQSQLQTSSDMVGFLLNRFNNKW